MIGAGTLSFDLKQTEYLHVKYKEHFFIGYGTTADFSAATKYSTIVPYEAGRRTYYGSVRLGNVRFSKAFKIADHTNKILVLNSLVDTSDSLDQRGYVELYSKTVELYFDAVIKA